MNQNLKKLGEAELEIMQVIWGGEGRMTSNSILKELHGKRSWQLSTLMTSLSRLCEKGYLVCEKSSGTNLYFAAVSENDYKVGASGSFLKKLYGNSVSSLVATLYKNRMLNSEDVKELREYLDKLESENSD